ncbi:MAG: hypothetical protein IT165_11220 [Bryobacterales bacterium]|nr:hypothetical protein [Bryobacterales bacterium]
MQRIFPLILATAFGAGSGLAQVPKSQGFVYQGFGSNYGTAFGHTGAGGEGVVWKGITAGGDIGAIYPFRAPAEVFGVLNVNGGYHFLAGRKDTKWDPFVTAGYSLFFRQGSANGANYGGGVVYWAKPKIGIRAEFRNHQYSVNERGFPEFRIGVAFH